MAAAKIPSCGEQNVKSGERKGAMCLFRFVNPSVLCT